MKFWKYLNFTTKYKKGNSTFLRNYLKSLNHIFKFDHSNWDILIP